jgi:hypothetical protein
MKRLIICSALLAAMSLALAADAGAKKAPATTAAAPAVGNLIVTLVSPVGTVTSPYISSYAIVTNLDVPPCGSLLSCNVVSYVRFWIDLPNNRTSCPASRPTCQFMGQDDQPLYFLGGRYDGPNGQHTATVQVWRNVSGDSAPVLLGKDSHQFCLNNC